MAKIIDKPFDMAKRIARAIFRGSPNLTTTADLNRQIESLQAQINAIEGKVGVRLINFNEIEAYANPSTHKVYVHFEPNDDDDTGNPLEMFLQVRGCQFSLGSSSFNTESLSYNTSSSTNYFYLVANLGSPTLVTFEDNPSHDISGASFQDGTASAAADHYQYPATPIISLRTNYTLGENEVLLAKVIVDGPDDSAHIWLNNLSSGDSVKIDDARRMSYYNPKGTTGAGLGNSYDNILSTVFRSLVPIGTILPFYGEIADLGSAFGWVPCIPIAKGSIGASVESFASNALYAAFKALYGNNITFEVVNSAGFSYLRISACKGKTIPNLFGKFLTGASMFSETTIAEATHYEKGATGGENRHKLTSSESGVPAHTHTTDSQGLHHHQIYADVEKDTSGYLKNWIGRSMNSESYSPQYQDGAAGTPFTLDAGYHTHTALANDTADASSSHENRPPYYAVYYIMRVC